MTFDGCLTGLGNPGPGYAKNRHNLGFMTARAWLCLCQRPRPPKPLSFSQGELYDAVAPGGGRILTLMPSTFMNLSGRAVVQALHYYKIPLDRLLVVHDELDLPFGRIKLKRGGGDAGHNGVASVSQECGSPEYYRLRLGVGRPPQGWESARFVLADFFPAEAPVAARIVARAAEAVADFFALGAARAANRVNAYDALAETKEADTA